MIYVVEGLDRCGKSTFIDFLRSQIKNPKIMVIHSGKPPKNVDVEKWTRSYYGNLMNEINDLSYKEFDIILDRSWIGELVYGPIYRNVHIKIHELECYIDTKQCILLTFVDSAENALSRDDGLSMSTDYQNKLYEIESFKAAHDSSYIQSKYMIDWSIIDFSENLLKNFAAELANTGQIDAKYFRHSETNTNEIQKQ